MGRDEGGSAGRNIVVDGGKGRRGGDGFDERLVIGTIFG